MGLWDRPRELPTFLRGVLFGLLVGAAVGVCIQPRVMGYMQQEFLVIYLLLFLPLTLYIALRFLLAPELRWARNAIADRLAAAGTEAIDTVRFGAETVAGIGCVLMIATSVGAYFIEALAHNGVRTLAVLLLLAAYLANALAEAGADRRVRRRRRRP